VAADGVGAQIAARHEQLIRDLWLRCVQQHRLDPTRMKKPSSCRSGGCVSTGV
jgi:sigma-54 dependent transcriptional regulator, acetoin dehydrogenase operon transcriptional activator AcoR